jgi:hypothetical protein
MVHLVAAMVTHLVPAMVTITFIITRACFFGAHLPCSHGFGCSLRARIQGIQVQVLSAAGTTQCRYAWVSVYFGGGKSCLETLMVLDFGQVVNFT